MGKIIYERQIDERIENKRLDTSLLRKRGSAKTYPGTLLAKMKQARQEGNFDVAMLLEWCYKEYMRFQEVSKVRLDSWKGKSSFKVIKKPDSFVIVTYQKDSKDEEPHEVLTEVTKDEVNQILIGLQKLNKGEKISTRELGEFIYKRKWDDIFADRHQHIKMNLMLRMLDKFGLIQYRSRWSLVLDKKLDIQLLLK